MPLILKSQVGREELTAYHSQSATFIFEGNELRSQREEALDFKILAKTTKTDRYIHQIVTVAEKDGTTDLHDLAFPDIGEELLLILTPQGKVIQAGNYPTTSIFYVPPLSLPEKAVEVGDTWLLKSQWTHSKNGTRMKLEVLTIFKELLKCGADECVDLEVSGSVQLEDLPINPLKSEIKGRLLFNRTQGSLVWGVLYNREEFQQESGRILVSSCLESVLVEPAKEAWPGKQALCKPEAISGIPNGEM